MQGPVGEDVEHDGPNLGFQLIVAKPQRLVERLSLRAGGRQKSRDRNCPQGRNNPKNWTEKFDIFEQFPPDPRLPSFNLL